MKKRFFKAGILPAIFCALLSQGFLLQGCTWSEPPQGEVNVVSVYTAEDDAYCYCFAEVQICNTGSCSIYTSTVSVQASTDKNTYYKSAALATTITPGKSIFITVDFSFPLEKSTGTTSTTTSTSTTTASSDTSGLSGTSGSSETTGSSSTTCSSGTTGTTSSSDTSSSSTSSSSSDSSSSSSSTSTTTGTSTTTTTNRVNEEETEFWQTDSVKIIDAFFE